MSDLENCSSLDLQEALMAQLEEMQTEIRDLKKQLAQKKLENSNLLKAAEQFHDESQSAESRIQELETQIQTQSSEISKLVNELRLKSGTIVKLNEQIAKLHSSDVILKENVSLSKEIVKVKKHAKAEISEAQETSDKVKRLAEAGERLAQERSNKICGCMGIVVGVIALGELVLHRAALVDFGTWFAHRGRNIAAAFSWLCGAFLSLSEWFSGVLPENWPVFPGYILSAIAFLLGIAVLLLVILFLFDWKLGGFLANMRDERIFKYPEFKLYVVIAISVAALYLCIIFCDVIKGVMPFNLMSLWLTASLIAFVVGYWKEIFNAAKDA